MRRADYTLVAIVIALLGFGIVMLSSASSVVAWQGYHDSFYFTKRQILIGVLPGVALLYFFSKFDYRNLKKIVLPLLLASLALLVLVFFPGVGQGYGRARWIYLPGGFSFQPSEFAKLSFFMYLSAWLSAKKQGDRKLQSSLWPFLILISIITGLLILQPDLGTLTIIVIISFIIYFVAGAPLPHLGLLAFGGISGFILLVAIAPYRLARLTTFLHPNLDPQGIGYHLNQALIAIGSGGLFGKGLGLSRQKFLYLPEVVSDSIFAVTAEELGFFMSMGLLGLFVVFALRGFTIAKYAPDLFGKLLATGITSWIIIQMFANVGSMLSVLPLTGVPLPFISYGGSATIATLAATGILFNISRHAKT